LWEHDGDFEHYLGVKLEIDKHGKLVGEVDESHKYLNPSAKATKTNDEKIPNDPEHNDDEWPGEYPEEDFSMTVNVRHDSFPFETTWSVTYLKNNTNDDSSSGDLIQDEERDGEQYKDLMSEIFHIFPFLMEEEDSDNRWKAIYASKPGDGVSNTLQSKTLKNLEPGIYHYEMHDKNGICCHYRNGWITITAGVPKKKVLWDHNGEFENKVEAILRLDKDGTFHVIDADSDSS
jgi:hypothetical protein